MNSKKANSLLIALVLIFGLTAGFIGFKFKQQKAVAHQLEAEKSAINEDYDELTGQFEELNDSYEALQAENVQLDTELKARMEELDRKRDEVSRLIRQGGSGELQKARELIASLQEENRLLHEEVDRLMMENEALMAENARLETDLEQEKETTARLTNDNIKLTANLVEVTNERDRLVPIANYGQVVHLSDLEAVPVRLKDNGNDRRVRSARKAEQLKVCFRMEDNPVVEQGDQQYLIRIVSPEGATLSADQAGTFLPFEAEGEMLYTAEAVVDFANGSGDQVCWYWDQTTEFQKGEYVAEIYHRGHKVGADKFEL